MINQYYVLMHQAKDGKILETIGVYDDPNIMHQSRRAFEAWRKARNKPVYAFFIETFLLNEIYK